MVGTRIFDNSHVKAALFQKQALKHWNIIAVAVGVFTLGLGALTALSKSKKHFVGLTWAAGDAKGGFAMQCDKNDYRGVLAGLEGVTGKKAVDSEAMTVKN